jgi:hypothetical protein
MVLGRDYSRSEQAEQPNVPLPLQTLKPRKNISLASLIK